MDAPKAFRLPKAGASRAEYEDAIAWSECALRYAVADGASASAFARLWAHLLVHAFTAGWLAPGTLETDLAPAQARWAELVDTRPLPWYAAEQVRRGAFAALAGLHLSDDGNWSALAVGDCCVFQVRAETLVSAFPLCDPDAFDNRPFLLSSRPAANRTLRESHAIATTSGTWLPGDTFLLMSDALAATFLRLARQTSPLSVLDFEPTFGSFRAWVQALRAERVLRNDDVSLLWLTTNVDAPA